MEGVRLKSLKRLKRINLCRCFKGKERERESKRVKDKRFRVKKREKVKK